MGDVINLDFHRRLKQSIEESLSKAIDRYQNNQRTLEEKLLVPNHPGLFDLYVNDSNILAKQITFFEEHDEPHYSEFVGRYFFTMKFFNTQGGVLWDAVVGSNQQFQTNESFLLKIRRRLDVAIKIVELSLSDWHGPAEQLLISFIKSGEPDLETVLKGFRTDWLLSFNESEYNRKEIDRLLKDGGYYEITLSEDHLIIELDQYSFLIDFKTPDVQTLRNINFDLNTHLTSDQRRQTVINLNRGNKDD